jgi:hypothetical protein
MNSHLPISGFLNELDFATILSLMRERAPDGQLKITASQFTKTVWLQEGAVVFAQSSLADDSFGNFLRQRGVIDEGQFEKSRRRMQKNKIRHGRALLEMGLITPEQLWSEIASHLGHIVFSLFPLRSGRYDIGPLPDGGKENIRMELSVPQVIAEGVRRITDEEFIESRFAPDITLYPVTDRNPDISLKPYEEHVLSLVAEATSLESVLRRSELLRLDTLKTLYLLRKLGLVCDREQPTRQPTPNTAQGLPTTFGSFEETLQYYNAKFEYIFRVLSKEIGPVAHAILSDSITAIQESIPPCFQDLQLRPDGRLDEKSIMKSVWYENFSDNSNEFLRGLEEILYSEIYAVKRHLGKEHERQLLRWIRESGN